MCWGCCLACLTAYYTVVPLPRGALGAAGVGVGVGVGGGEVTAVIAMPESGQPCRPHRHAINPQACVRCVCVGHPAQAAAEGGGAAYHCLGPCCAFAQHNRTDLGRFACRRACQGSADPARRTPGCV